MKLEELVNINYSKLNENDIYILKYVLANKKKCSELGINDLATKCNVSRTTILRFTQKLGFKGYSEFKVHLKWQEQQGSKMNEDSVEVLYKDFEETMKVLKQTDFTEVCRVLYYADRVFIYGTGTAQRVIAREMQRKFLYVYKYMSVIEGDRELECVINNLTSRDVIIIISLSGEREYLQDVVKGLYARGIDTITMTRFSNNKIARYSPYNFYICTTVIETPGCVNYESTTNFFLLVDVLFRKYLNYAKQQSLKLEENYNEKEDIKRYKD